MKLGLIESLNKPGGNVTGITFLLTQMESKRLGLLHELVPRATMLAVMINPGQPAASDQASQVTEAAQALGVQVRIVNVSSERDLELAFATCVQLRVVASWSRPIRSSTLRMNRSSRSLRAILSRQCYLFPGIALSAQRSSCMGQSQRAMKTAANIPTN